MKSHAIILQDLETKIKGIEEDLVLGSLTDAKLRKLYQQRYNLRDRFRINTNNPFTKNERLTTSRYYELIALYGYGCDIGLESVEFELDQAVKFLPEGEALYSDLANKLHKKGLSSVNLAKSRKATLHDHIGAVGDNTPGQLATYIIVAILIIAGLAYILTKPADTDPADQGPDCSSQPYNAQC